MTAFNSTIENLVIGGSGFIGSALVKILKEKGQKVIITSQSKKEIKNITTLKYDIDSFKKILKKYNFKDVYFLSGNPYPKNSQNDFLIDFELLNIPFFSLLQAMKDINFKGNCWLASSVAVYGNSKKSILSENDECFPLSNYGVSKLNAEEYVKYFSRVYDINCGVFRIFSTYGENLERQLIYDIYKKIKKTPKLIKVLGTGDEARDFSYVDDQVEKMFLVAQSIKPKGDIINIGSGKLYTVQEVISTIKNILNVKTEIEYNGKTRSFDGMSWKANISKLNRLGYKGERSLKEGLQETIFAYEQRHKK